MSAKKPLSFDRSDRERSLAMLDQIQTGVARTAQVTEQTPPLGTHPQAGPLLAVPQSQIAAMLMEFFVTIEFARDMVEQLQALEKKTGERADVLNVNRYAGVIIPRGVTEVVVADNTLSAIVQVPSTLMPGQFVSARHPLVVADTATDTGEVFGLDQLYAAKKAFDEAHPKETRQ